jgi:hypothetical protein
VKRAGHDTVGGIESLFDTISVVDVDVDVQDALLVAKELEDRENYICSKTLSASRTTHRRSVTKHTVDITESTGFALLGVVQPTSPIDGYVAFLAVEASSALHGPASTDTTELEQAVKHRTIITDIVLSLLAHVAVHVVWGDSPQEIDVLIGVKLRHLIDHGWLGALPGNRVSIPSSGVTDSSVACATNEPGAEGEEGW